MGKGKKKVAISKKEEEQAQKVVKIVFVSLICVICGEFFVILL